jgi:hypothetical protein
MTQSITNGFGAVRFPLTAPNLNDGGSSVDVGLNTLTQLIAAAVNAEFRTKWTSAIESLSPNSKIRGEYLQPVGSTFNEPPEPHQLTQTSLVWPILAVYRTGDPEDFDLTLCHRATRQTIHADWILGPLGVAEQKRMRGFLTAFLALVREVVRYGRHPAFDGNVRQFAGSFHSLQVTGVSGPGIARMLETDQGGGYYAVSAHLEAVERECNTSGGSSVELGLGYVTDETATADDLEEIDLAPFEADGLEVYPAEGD